MPALPITIDRKKWCVIWPKGQAETFKQTDDEEQKCMLIFK